MTRSIALLVATTLALTASLATAATKLDGRLDAATEILTDLNRIPEQAIPSNLLNRAYAVAVVPSVVKAGAFMVGGSFGKGVIITRKPDGSWSNPAFIRLGNVAVGPQLGIQGADLILVFKSQRGVQQIAEGKLTLGGSIAASAGPVGRTAVAATDGSFKSEIYTYARSRGLFAGITLDGGGLTMDSSANGAYYGNDGEAWRILNDASVPTSVAGQRFIDRLSSMAPRLQWQTNDGIRNAQSAPPAATDSSTRTYAVEDTTTPAAPETMF